MKNKNGITLISLIITIIILLILAGVTISILLGNNGLINTAKEAGEEYKIQSAKEKLEIKLTDITIRIYEKENRKTTLQDLIIINKEETTMKVETIQEDEEGNQIEEIVKIYTDETEGKQYTKIIVDGYVFKVDENMKITYIGNYKEEEKERVDPERDKDYEEDDEIKDENDTGEIVLDKDIIKDENADKIDLTEVPNGWIGIYTEQDLIDIKKDLTKKYIIMADIELKENWQPLGDSKQGFSGYLNGNGHTITNLKITGENGYLGMFAKTTGTANITNLTLTNYLVKGKGRFVGGLVGYNRANICNVYAKGNIEITGNTSYIGGLVGIHKYYSKTTTNIEKVYTCRNNKCIRIWILCRWNCREYTTDIVQSIIAIQEYITHIHQQL